MRVLILGGTSEARELAAALLARGDVPVTSLAGAVREPQRPPGELRVGALATPQDLTRLARDTGADAVVDATHPFAAGITALAARALIPVIHLHRPPWPERPGDRWTRVPDLAAAAAAIAPGRRVLLTTGRRGLEAFAQAGAWFLIRSITPPGPPLPPHHALLLDRGPYTLESERALLTRHAIDLIVTKDSGGAATEAKLAAARERGLPVIVVDRPPPPPGAVATVAEVLARLK